jgi:hypothetical protein
MTWHMFPNHVSSWWASPDLVVGTLDFHSDAPLGSYSENPALREIAAQLDKLALNLSGF